MESTVAPSEALAKHLIKQVQKDGLTAALDSVAWPERDAYARATYEEITRANLFGRMEVWMEAEGKTGLDRADWVKLPFEEAIAYFKDRAPILSKKAFDKLTDALKAKSWTIAGDHDSYTRAQVKESLDLALAEGMSKAAWLDEAQDMFDRMGVTGLGNHHLETVFDTNVNGAYQHGRWKQQNTPNMVKRRPIFRYKTVGDVRVRDAHAAMQGFTAHRDHPAWSTWYPPNGYRCRCRIEALRVSNDLDITANDTAAPAEPDEGFATTPTEWLVDTKPKAR